ncbi:MAG: hypothetical protein U0X91_32715 [Spirosomataceae bacterium]
MSSTLQNKIVSALSLILTGLVTFVSLVGWLNADFYRRETPNWQAQVVGQDLADLFLAVPVLVISAFMVVRNHRNAFLVWGGTVMYLLYTFLIYAFAVHFNSLFWVYCLTLGTSFYSALFFFYCLLRMETRVSLPVSSVNRFTGAYLMVIAGLFYLLWLSEVIPHAWYHTVPPTLIAAGLPANPVQVIDLAVFLPGMFGVGWLLFQRKKWGHLLAPVFLSFCVLMDLTIGGLTLLMQYRGVAPGSFVAILMGVLALISLVLLIVLLKRLTYLPLRK